MSSNPRLKFLKRLFIENGKEKKRKRKGGNALEDRENRDIRVKEDKSLDIPKTLKSEFHFLKFPFFDLSPRISKKDKIEIQEVEETENEKIEILWRVSRNINSDFPSSFARRVHKEIIEKTINGLKKPVPRLIKLGSLRQICKEMTISPSGGNCKEIKKALKDITSATVEARGTFRKKEKDGAKKFFDGVFHLYDMVFFTGEILPDGTKADSVYVFLNDMYVQNFNNNFVVPMDYNYFHSLKGDITSRMYEILSIWFYPALEYGHRFINKEYSEICSYFPLTPQDAKWKAKKQLKDAHKQHVLSGFLNKNPEWFDNGKKNDWTIRYCIGSKAKEWYQQNRRIKDGDGEIKMIGEPSHEKKSFSKKASIFEDPLVDQLVNLGITQEVAENLVENSNPDAIRYWIKAIDYTNAKDKAAFLVKAIQEEWQLPAKFQKKKKKEEYEKKKLEYSQFINTQIEKHLGQIKKEDIEKGLKKQKEIFLKKFPSFLDSQDSDHVKSYIENAYRISIQKELGLPSFEEWLEQ